MGCKLYVQPFLRLVILPQSYLPPARMVPLECMCLSPVTAGSTNEYSEI